MQHQSSPRRLNTNGHKGKSNDQCHDKSHEIEIKAMVCMQFSANNFPHVRQCGHNPESYILYADRKKPRCKKYKVAFPFLFFFYVMIIEKYWSRFVFITIKVKSTYKMLTEAAFI
ncbi:hypothetical protein Peur_011650 [Populus x canadensis]